MRDIKEAIFFCPACQAEVPAVDTKLSFLNNFNRRLHNCPAKAEVTQIKVAVEMGLTRHMEERAKRAAR